MARVTQILALIAVAIVALALNVFALPPAITALSVMLLSIVMAGYSIYGISRIDQKRRFINDLGS